jgi:CDP-paratose 2-epimerase
MKVIVTGGCGFIGSNICVFLKNLSFDVISVDNCSKTYSKLNLKRLNSLNIKNYNIDISNKNKFIKLNFKSDIIIDCCADPVVESSRKDILKNINNNLITTYNVLEKAKKDKSKLIFLSTSRIYPIKDSYQKFKMFYKKKNKKDLFDEKSNIIGAKTIYGFSKLSSEMLIKEYNYAFNIDYLINRCGLITGPWQFGKVEQGLVSLWLWKHLNKDNNLYYKGYNGSGNQIRDILFINDLCELVYLQIKKFKKIKNQTFCVGGGIKNSANLNELTKNCEVITKNKLQIKHDLGTSIYDIPFYITSLDKVKKYYNWHPKIDLKIGLYTILEWMKKNYTLIKPHF